MDPFLLPGLVGGGRFGAEGEGGRLKERRRVEEGRGVRVVKGERGMGAS